MSLETAFLTTTLYDSAIQIASIYAVNSTLRSLRGQRINDHRLTNLLKTFSAFPMCFSTVFTDILSNLAISL